MAYTHIIPVVSATAGEDDDGSLVGRVLGSNFADAFANVRLAAQAYVYRKDVAGTTFSFEDVSAAANDDTPSDFLPFGTTAQMSAGDECLIACEHHIKELYFRIATPGVWTGTIEIRYSTNGQTANATLQNVVDGTNGFRATAGVYGISFTVPTDIVAFSPVPGEIASRRWLVLKPTVTAVTTAPVLSRIWINHTDESVTYLNPTINDSILTGPSAPQHPPTYFPTVDSAVHFAFSNPAFGIERNIYRRQENVRTRVLEYLASDGTWKTLTGVNDPSSDYTNGPATLTEVTITGATQATPCVITATGHGLSTGNTVRVHSIVGMTELNENDYRVTVIDANSFSINANSTAFTAYASGGKAVLYNRYSVRWTVPTDWASSTLTFATSTGDVSATGYWVRVRTTAVTQYGPTQSVLANVRAKQFGDATTAGFVVPVTTTIRAVTIDEPLSMSGTGAVELQLVNFTQGQSAPISIPASPTWPLNVDIADLTLAANERYGLVYSSGTRTFTSVPITIHT